MTAIDFAVFVDTLATISGEAILPYFRTSLGVEDKGSAAGFDPVSRNFPFAPGKQCVVERK